MPPNACWSWGQACLRCVSPIISSSLSRSFCSRHHYLFARIGKVYLFSYYVPLLSDYCSLLLQHLLNLTLFIFLLVEMDAWQTLYLLKYTVFNFGGFFYLFFGFLEDFYLGSGFSLEVLDVGKIKLLMGILLFLRWWSLKQIKWHFHTPIWLHKLHLIDRLVIVNKPFKKFHV